MRSNTGRPGGIYALRALARENSGDYHRQIRNLLCAFARRPNRKSDAVLGDSIGSGFSTEVVEFDSGLDKEGNESPLPVREDVHEVITVLRHRSKAQIEIDKSTRLNLSRAYLVGATLVGIDLVGANLIDANLTGVNLTSCKGLTQEQIDRAKADPDNPSKLEGVIDAETGKPLVWAGKATSSKQI